MSCISFYFLCLVFSLSFSCPHTCYLSTGFWHMSLNLSFAVSSLMAVCLLALCFPNDSWYSDFPLLTLQLFWTSLYYCEWSAKLDFDFISCIPSPAFHTAITWHCLYIDISFSVLGLVALSLLASLFLVTTMKTLVAIYIESMRRQIGFVWTSLRMGVENG